jgi:DNA-binding MarR family transcriptional regulator
MADDPLRWLNAEMRALLAESAGEAPPTVDGRPVRYWPLSNDDRVGHWLERAHHAHAALMREAVSDLGITPAQAALLLDVNQPRQVWTHDHLARRLRVSRSVVTRMLRRLVALGLVTVEGDYGDRRQRPPRLSTAGQALIAGLEERLESAENELRGRLRPSQGRWLMVALPQVETAARRAWAEARRGRL